MATSPSHTRTRSNTVTGPHSVSLKVLRLSRPSLATQTPLPATNFGDGLDISPKASVAYPTSDEAHQHGAFPLTPLLTLPAAFGAAYVGETFTCTLCANNELPTDTSNKTVSGVKIAAELQTPSHPDGIALQLEKAGKAEDGDDGGDVQPGGTLQRTLGHDLKDEGPHVLAVTVTYTETLHGNGAASGGRARTFRKLYQFLSQQLVAVRSKVTERKKRDKDSAGPREWVLEAQVENVGETSVVVEKVKLKEREGITSREMMNGEEGREALVLKPQDVEQVMFILKEETEQKDEEVGVRVPLGQLHIDWRSAMGEKGSLTTGWLSSRGR
ncbi:putative trafficking protein particle complex subunit 13 [Fulvia fulva]|uniref:Trafficking protein particle complex subunit 13 n=1 Tax=Passalora fulva TaxID=5499 RepID=A0A9Q8PLI5_PASFU|nr:putative trafficking protein particle complex subunit 13 [Fulvia fulva]KAK4610685.1 putative trafficking protein particle complex subunit 13 [Fulvia fulva]KAK4611299.1 putative trafficking protein particle complex subunit 13 [Fulvia fulva]UJO24632.1 putative trafficking protein particle complex subunit 13 [Fulvia fulva]WPV22116.1 putative trafficking protein particle complex subunit 13 [Fulvia fulva]WPV37006.1 putative trafficking protein particle complex subunit 13 [Fulvia fulva]